MTAYGTFETLASLPKSETLASLTKRMAREHVGVVAENWRDQQDNHHD
jgi:hypothetical protein